MTPRPSPCSRLMRLSAAAALLALLLLSGWHSHGPRIAQGRRRKAHRPARKSAAVPCPRLPPPQPLPAGAASGLCRKLIYLHIPKCGGSTAMASFQALSARGVKVLKHTQHANHSLAAEIAMEAADPWRFPRKVIEIHVSSGSYRDDHAAIMELRGSYERAGCAVALATLVREPESLARSWFTYCSKQGAKLKGRPQMKYFMPPFWGMLKACGRRNVMTHFLATGAMCEVEPNVEYDDNTVTDLSRILSDFDLLDDVRNFSTWLARAFHFMNEGNRCAIVNKNYHGSKAFSEETLRLDLGLPAAQPALDGGRPPYCAWSPDNVELVTGAADRSTAHLLPQTDMDALTSRDKQLYALLQPRLRQVAAQGLLHLDDGL
mmetsp:Transcript_36176/g.93950  ORF Transcript_36176/g.93950 Transcript_36176/m.93950 type:complete len:376 (+) Transcript_36176:76-1203(+)